MKLTPHQRKEALQRLAEGAVQADFGAHLWCIAGDYQPVGSAEPFQLTFLLLASPLTASASVKKVILLKTTGLQSWTVPSDFNSYDNIIEAIGGGGGGGNTGGNSGSSGGGGGAYAKSFNDEYARQQSEAIQPITRAGIRLAARNSRGDRCLFRTGFGAQFRFKVLIPDKTR